MKEIGIPILALNEKKLDKNIDDSLVNIDGYTINRHDRDRQGGVVAIYLKNTLLDKNTVREDLPNSALELNIHFPYSLIIALRNSAVNIIVHTTVTLMFALLIDG